MFIHSFIHLCSFIYSFLITHSLQECLPKCFLGGKKVKVKVKSLSHVQLFATPWTAAHQAPLSMGFSRQEYWCGWPLSSPMHESESESEVTQSCPTLCDPMDCSLPGCSVHGILQARVLGWGAIAFSMICDTRGT